MSSVFANLWSFLLTLVRSLLALFSFRRRTSTPNDALARAHSHLRPIVLTPRSIAIAHTQRIPSATTTLHDNATATAPSDPQRTSPKLDAIDPELGLPVTAYELPGPPAVSAASFREGTPDTSGTGSSSCAAPLTPPERCYLAPLSSATDCPYIESWSANAPVDRSKLPGSPLRVSMTSFPEPMVAPIGSPPPGRWNPTAIWTSTPSLKDDSLAVPDSAHSSYDHHRDSSALVNISHALISRSQSSLQPYDDASRSSMSSGASPLVNPVNGPGPTRERHRAQAQISRAKRHPYPRFHHPDAYAWRYHGGRLPGKGNRTHEHPSPHSHTNRTGREWYNANAYAQSPIPVLSLPLAEDSEDSEDELPLSGLRERLTRRGPGFGIPGGVAMRASTGASHTHARRMSEGCLLAIAESTPTRIGLRTRSGRHAISLALDGDGCDVKDWLEALSLQFTSNRKDVARASESVPSVKVLAV